MSKERPNQLPRPAQLPGALFHPIPTQSWLDGNGDRAAFLMQIERGAFPALWDAERSFRFPFNSNWIPPPRTRKRAKGRVKA